MTASTEVVWRPQKGPQHALIKCPADEVFFGGARGGGKTDAIIGKAALRARHYGEHENQIIFRREMPAADDIIARAQQVFGALGAKWNGQDRIWRWPNGARTRVRPLERKDDADKYQGQNITFACIEEAGQYPDPGPIDRLHAVLRSAHGIPTQLILTGNPGGPGQHWLKRRYIDPYPRGNKFMHREVAKGVGLQYVYIPSRVADNRILMDQDPNYVARLQMVGSEQLVRAWLYGDWDAVEGAFFDCWSHDRHVLKPFEIPEHWTRFRSMDWGSAAPFSVGWWTVATEDTKVQGRLIPRGALIRYREWYGADEPNKGLKWPAEDVGAGILARETENEDIRYGVLDPAAFAQDGGPSIAERLAKVGVVFRPADNKRVGKQGAMGGWDQMRARMVGNEDGHPMLFVFDTCTEFIRTVPMLQHDDARPEDLDTESEDHCFTADTEILEKDGKVWSQGEWRPYRSARITRRNVILYRVSFSDGNTVRCTPKHRFWTTSGWVEARHLTRKTLPLSQPQGRISEDSVTTFAALTSRAHGAETGSGGENASIERYGFTTTAQSPRGITSTTGTVIEPIIDWRTWISSPLATICRCIRESGSIMASLSRRVMMPDSVRPNGTAVMRGETGIGSIMRTPFARSGSAPSRSIVSSAARSTKRYIQGAISRNSAHVHASSVRCVGVEPAGHGDVYCLTVPDTGQFTLSNGLTVANCADEARYACMSRPYTRAAPKSPDDITRQPTFNELLASQKRPDERI